MSSLRVTLYLCAVFFQAGSVVRAQAEVDWKSCAVTATLPADLNWTEPIGSRQRFEIRVCWGHLAIVLGYERNKTAPALVFDTGDGYPSYLVHSFNVLVFQSMGGASDHVYVFTFRSGKPSVALKTATKDMIDVVQTGKSITVVVPPPIYPGPEGKFPPEPPPAKHSFPIEY
ncbi:MAG: hypothetical protein LLG20_04740 [Acidobacteriales bacterium]|nr:hypothetical protein [Terriglobales bacterium]